MLKIIGYFYVLVMILNGLAVHSSQNCDSSVHSPQVPKEGLIGETAAFPWLGILKIYLRDIETVKVALTGVVLIKEEFAIVNADDVARIPKKIFKENSQAMFIVKEKQPWYCSLRDYITHPEYKHPTVNTIALVHLDTGGQKFPILPICWPHHSYNTMHKLYSVGFTDDNGPLEKFLYKMRLIDLDACNDFYKAEDLTEKEMIPNSYKCAVAPNLKNNCVWDNGLALISIVYGYWILLGFGVRGPGCAAPARFIDLQSYFHWIQLSTSMETADIEFRRTTFNDGFRKSSKFIRNPHDALFSSNYPFDTGSHQNNYFTIDMIEKDAIEITPPNKEKGFNCSGLSYVVYRDEVKINRSGTWEWPRQVRVAYYKVSMFDLHYFNYACATFKLTSALKSETRLYYRTMLEGISNAIFGETPDEIIRHYITKNLTEEEIEQEKKTSDPNYFRKPSYMKPASITDRTDYEGVYNMNVLLKLQFYDEATFEVKIYGDKLVQEFSPHHTTTAKMRYPDY